ncbi:MAG: bifunctional 5,10-methylenetetrahydrofolate dehydrogenase/5,10-methenyltetrahydrofolate cyclohydrolase [Patescibacteria group bacterium]
MQKISGAEIAQKIIDDLKSRSKPDKIFAAILVGENDSTSSPQVRASISFLKQKGKIAEELGVDFRVYRFPEEIKNDDLRKKVGKIALLGPVGGVIVQLPLPVHLNRHYILNVIPREKDIDVLGERALGAFYNDRNFVLPPSVGVVETILNSQSYILNSKKVAVVGPGFLVGKPITTWLIGKCPEIYLLDQGSDFSILKQTDLVITGTGQPGLIKPRMLKDGAGVIDFGYSIDENGKIKGDFDFNSLVASGYPLNFYTPTPNGTGPILVAKIFENFYKLNKSNE